MGETFVVDMLRDLHDAGVTWMRIARHLGVADSTVGGWAHGKHTPNGYVIFRLARLHRHLTTAEGRAA